MNAEIITIGDEILIGQIVDTNSAWLAARLGESGIKVGRIVSIRDSREEMTVAFDSAFERADLILVTGGLGPTKDDITKQTLAEYFHSPLVVHRPTFEFLERMVKERGMEFNELNRRQADVPECCTVLPNRNGTAPAMLFERGGKILVSMPGVPFEMKIIFTDELEPRLEDYFDLKSVVHKTAVVYGIPESKLAIMLEEWEDSLPTHIKLAYLPNPRGIRLRLSAYEVDGREAGAEIEALFERLQAIIPDNVIGFGDVTLESVVADMLHRRGETLSTAESCSGGAIAARFVAMAGASDYFTGGVVAYSNESKSAILGVRAEDIASHGAVSSAVAAQMAEGARRATGSTYAVATTGIAGPGGGTPEKPVGTVWIAVATPHKTITRLFNFGHLREENIKRTVNNAINMLRLVLVER